MWPFEDRKRREEEARAKMEADIRASCIDMHAREAAWSWYCIESDALGRPVESVHIDRAWRDFFHHITLRREWEAMRP